jgi:alpha-beta hydrolase superfamily lysophospholipase
VDEFPSEVGTGCVWRPTARATGVVVLVHGLQSHAGWFVDAGRALAERGLAVYAPDRRGSGLSLAARGDVEDYARWFDDLAAVIGLAAGEYPGTPVHLVGHCFGANLALGCALSHQVPISSLVMLTPGLYVLPTYRWLERLRIGLAAVFAPRRRFRVPQDDALFSRDPAVLAWIREDQLGARQVTARCLLQIQRMLTYLRKGLIDLDVPLLVVEAGRDRLADNRRNRHLLESRLGARCVWATFDAEHFLLAEACQHQVIDALVEWTSTHT